MLTLLDNFLNRITMYRLVLYCLLVIYGTALGLSIFKVLPYNPVDLLVSALVIGISCLISNKIFSLIFRIPTNAESDYITAAILTLIITPGSDLLFLILAAVFSQAAKYILAFRGKHIFNPAAVAVVATLLIIGQGASWWIGSVYTLPVVLISGLLILRKVQRFEMVLIFLFVHLFTVLWNSSGDSWTVIETALVNSSLLYFTFIMFTEPFTSPTRRYWRWVYAVVVGLASGYYFTIGTLYSSPELALFVGNIFAFLVNDKARYKLALRQKAQIAAEIYSFEFEPNRKPNYKPGQYLEWTLDVQKPDARGNRRYFTIASSPTENKILLGVRFYENPSRFKQTLSELAPGERALAGQLSGDFILPNDKNKKLVFIAGGIGITPFRSMIKYLIDKNEKREITLLYSNRTEQEIVYKEIFDEAKRKLDIKTIFVITDKEGRITKDRIIKEVPDFLERQFYISGPRSAVVAFENLLKSMNVSKRNIKIDFFPGFV